ncbi:MAG: efflux RND transporter periplasmic adaptor subunit [Betaproteobacteria bacterium]|nr:efflux RND transporter periplasmic adaptor subunit [Betaproteobacteria bacterium]
MNKAVAIAGAIIAIVSIAAGAYWLGKSSSQTATQSKGPPSTSVAKGAAAVGVSVEASTVATAKLAKSITAVGSLRSDESIIVRPEVSGRVSEILFKEGQRVEKGAALVRIDDSVQRAELEQAKANLSLGKSKLDRAMDLQKKGFISSQAREEAENNFRVAQAAFDLASARLTKLEIKAPFSGLVGLRQVSVGDYIKDGQDIANLEGIDPLKVDFRVPEIYLKQVAVNQTLQVTLDALPDKTIAGRVFAINPLLDANGRSIIVRAVVHNADARLRPGMFARVRLLTAESAESMTVPEQALVPVADEVYVFRVVDGKALRTRVEIGQRQAGIVEVVRGLTPGDLVVTAGQIKIRDGSAVQIASNTREAPPQLPDKATPAAAVPAAKKT